MLELAATRVAVIECHAAPTAADALADLEGAHAYRVAPDEVLLLAEPEAAKELPEIAAKTVEAADPDALILEATDGWAAFTLTGEDVREAFTFLSAVPLPAEGFTQGDVAHVPVKVVVEPHRLLLLVPTMWEAHLRERILVDCSHLDVGAVDEPVAWIPGGRR